jgi:hypothetical protein
MEAICSSETSSELCVGLHYFVSRTYNISKLTCFYVSMKLYLILKRNIQDDLFEMLKK